MSPAASAVPSRGSTAPRSTVLPTVVLAALFACPSPGQADIYRCVGPNGTVHYTNSRPSGGHRCRVAVKGRHRGEKQSKARRSRKSRTSRSASAARGPEQYASVIREAARLYKLPEAFLRAVVKVESGYQPDAVSHDGAMGLMQLMPKTASAMGVRNPFDPRQNILGGARYLRVLANKFNGDLVLTIAGYNAGEHAVMRHNGVPPYRETRRYVRRVLERYYAMRRAGSGQRRPATAE